MSRLDQVVNADASAMLGESSDSGRLNEALGGRRYFAPARECRGFAYTPVLLMAIRVGVLAKLLNCLGNGRSATSLPVDMTFRRRAVR
jgi:hypothetical protein